MTTETVFKRSPVVIIRDVVVLEAATFLLFVTAGYLAHYAKLYRALVPANFLSFQVAELLGVFIIQVLLMLFVFLRWHRESFKIRPGELVRRHGLLTRHETVYSLDAISAITCRQDVVGRRINFGDIYLHNNSANRTMRLSYIPDTQSWVESILNAKRARPVVASFTSQSAVSSNAVQLLARNEHEELERKSTFRWDVRNGKVNRMLEKSAMKTIAAFLNSRGGRLILGVDDAGAVVGLEADFATLNKPNADGFENHFSNVFQEMLGASFRQYVRLQWVAVDGKTCCVISVMPATMPAYMQTDNVEEFFIRAGNATTSLRMSESAAYINSRFRGA